MSSYHASSGRMGSALAAAALAAGHQVVIVSGPVDVDYPAAAEVIDVVSTDQHTVKPWFLGKLDFAPPVVDLAPIGFPLVGGRLDYLDGRPVAGLVYQRKKHTINVFVSPDRENAFAATGARSVRGFHVRHWVRDGMSFWAVSDLNETELDEFAHALQAS